MAWGELLEDGHVHDSEATGLERDLLLQQLAAGVELDGARAGGEVDAGEGVGGLEADRLPKGGDGFVEPAQFLQGAPEVDVGGGVVLLETDRLPRRGRTGRRRLHPGAVARPTTGRPGGRPCRRVQRASLPARVPAPGDDRPPLPRHDLRPARIDRRVRDRDRPPVPAAPGLARGRRGSRGGVTVRRVPVCKGRDMLPARAPAVRTASRARTPRTAGPTCTGIRASA